MKSARPSPPVLAPSLVYLSLANGKVLFLQGPPEMQPLPQGSTSLSMGSAPTIPPRRVLSIVLCVYPSTVTASGQAEL